MLLCFRAWLKNDHYWPIGDEQSLLDAKNAIATLLSALALHFDRSAGQDWSIPKFHERSFTLPTIFAFGVLIQTPILDPTSTTIY